MKPKIFDRRTLIKISIGSLLGVLTLYLAFRGVSVPQLRETLREVNPWLIIAGLSVVLVNVAIFSLRWWVMLMLDWQFSLYRTLLSGVYLGQMFNILLPLRLGELARIYFVSERIPVTKSRLLGSLVLEKVIDIVTFGGAVFLLLMAISLPTWVTEPSWTLIGLALASLLGVIGLARWGPSLLTWIAPIIKGLPSRWGERIAGILEGALTGFDSMRDWKRQFTIWLLSFLSLSLSALTNYLILLALDIRAPFSVALFVVIVLQVGSAPPSAPGKLGVFHYLIVLALSAYSIEKELALAYSLVLYVIAFLSKVVIGVLVLTFSRWQIPTLCLANESDP